MIHRTPWIVAPMILAAMTVALAQQVRDAQRPAPAVGNSVITGIVLSADATPAPIKRAHVTLSGADLLGGRIVITDDSGMFRFTGLPAGRFMLAAAKPAYLTANHGARRPGGEGIAIALADGQSLRDISLTLVKGGVITGRVTDERGRPQSAMTIVAARYRWLSGERRLMTTLSAFTDETGQYRIFGLDPGEYLIRANIVDTGSIRSLAPGEVDAALSPRSQTPTPTRPETTVGYSVIYFPGTAEVTEASKVTVAGGGEAGGIDFAVRLVPTTTISGKLVDPIGPLKPPVAVQLIGESIPSGQRRATVAAGLGDGFSFAGVTPGRYTLISSTAASSDPTGRMRWASIQLDVTSQRVDNLELRLQPGVTVSGRVQFENAGTEPPPMNWMVGLVASFSGVQVVAVSGATPVAADGTFTIPGATPGHYFVNAGAQAPTDARGRRWTLKSASLNGVDHVDQPIELRSGNDVTGVVITLTSERTELTGTLQTPAGDPAPGYFVIAFAADRARWARGMSSSIRAVRPGSDGQFRIADLRPGDFYLAAVDDLEQDEWLDPAVLEKIVPAAIKFSLGAGEKKVQDLRIIK